MSTLRTNRFENTSGVAYGTVLQVANYTTSALATGTTNTPSDDTIPQITEGTEFMSLAFTPKSASNKLKITVITFYGCSANTNVTTALFQDSTANALAAVCVTASTAGVSNNATLIHYMTAGTTSATTFKVRLGGNAASTVSFNGSAGVRIFGGVASSSITIEEIQV